MKQEIKTTTELFREHFGNVSSVNLTHPKIESFFNALKQECKKEDLKANKNIEYWKNY